MQCHKGANWKVHWSRCHQCNYTRLKLSRYSNWLKMVTGLAAANHHNALFVHTLKIVNDISPRSIIWRVQFIDFCLIWKKYCGQIIVQFLRLVSLIFDQSAFLAVIVSITFCVDELTCLYLSENSQQINFRLSFEIHVPCGSSQKFNGWTCGLWKPY